MWKSKGLYFIDETEEMTVETSGKITKIIEPSEYARMKVDGHYGADLYIDGEQYLIVTADDFQSAMQQAKEALELHLWGIEQDDGEIPASSFPEDIDCNDELVFYDRVHR